MNISDAKRLRQLEEENARLKRLVGEQALDIVVLKDVRSGFEKLDRELRWT